MTVPEIVVLIVIFMFDDDDQKSYSRMIEECFDNNSAFSIGVKTSVSSVINRNIDKSVSDSSIIMQIF